MRIQRARVCGLSYKRDMWHDEIAEIRRLAGLTPLEEAAPSARRLLPMFSGILQLLPRSQETITREIDWARETLEREDRIIWYLRYLQIAILEKASEDDPNFGDAADKKVRQLAQKSGQSPGTVKASLSMFIDGSVKQMLVHALSMPIAGIKQYVFGWQPAQEVYDDFQQLEKDWKDDQNRTVPFDDSHAVVIDFGDGYAWYNLDTAYCPDEARAMGHCGNSPRSGSDDRIISLRRKQQVGDEVILTPVLTFILDSNGLLGEMKGRGNDKPAERYHQYIIPLLRHESIEGIKGGGYMAQNNFSINDLDEEVRDELLAENPALEGPMELIRKTIKDGDYERSQKALEDLLNDYNLQHEEFTVDDWSSAHPQVILKRWQNFEDAARDYDDDAVSSLYDVYEELDDVGITTEQIEKTLLQRDIIIEILNKLPPREQQVVTDGTGTTDIEEATDVILKEGTANQFYHSLLDAAEEVISETDINAQTEKLKQEIIERLKLYANLGYSLRPFQFWAGPIGRTEDNPDAWKEEWAVHTSLNEAMNIIEAGAAGEDEYGGDEDYYAFHEWSDYQEGLRPDVDNVNEQRGDYGEHKSDDLSAMHEKDKLAVQIEENDFDFGVESMLMPIAAQFAAMIRMREETEAPDLDVILEAAFDRDFYDIIRLSNP